MRIKLFELRFNYSFRTEHSDMAGKQAKVLFDQHVQDLLAYASATRYPIRNRVIVLLSVKAGLRAGEIANLTWPMVLDPSGGIATAIELHDVAAKMGSGRRVPLHDDLREALAQWREINDGTAACRLLRTRRWNDPYRASSTGSAQRIRPSAWKGAHPIRAAGHSSPALPASFIKPVGRYAMSNCSLAIDPFRRPKGTSTATPTPSAGLSR